MVTAETRRPGIGIVAALVLGLFGPRCTCRDAAVVGGEPTAAELAKSLDRASRERDVGRFMALVLPDERHVAATMFLRVAFMGVVMNGAMRGAMQGFVQGLSGSDGGMPDAANEGAGAKSLASEFDAILHKHDIDWEALVRAADEQYETFEGAEQSLRLRFKGSDPVVVVREVYGLLAATESSRPLKLDLDIGDLALETLEVKDDQATISRKDSSGFAALRKAGDRWYYSQRASDPGERYKTDQDHRANARASLLGEAADALKDVARGVWRSKWGELTFNDDGSALFELRENCAVNEDEPNKVQLTPDCSPIKVSGSLEAEGNSFSLSSSAGSSQLFSAYLDADGRLHVATVLTDDIAPLDDKRRGKVDLGTFKVLEVGAECSLVDSMAESSTPVPCRFDERDGLTLFTFEVPEGTNVHHRSRARTMVYLPRERLLVPPKLHAISFERVGELRPGGG